MSFVDHATAVVALDADTIRTLLDESAHCGVAGGGIYDALILACARQAKAEAVLTFNERQFRFLARADVQVIVPP